MLRKGKSPMIDRLSNENIIEKVNSKAVRLTEHIIFRLKQRNIDISSVKNVLLNGEIIERYEDDYPHPSCLVLGISENNTPLHVVCGVGETEIWLITSYYPNLIEWENDYKSRKGK